MKWKMNNVVAFFTIILFVFVLFKSSDETNQEGAYHTSTPNNNPTQLQSTGQYSTQPQSTGQYSTSPQHTNTNPTNNANTYATTTNNDNTNTNTNTYPSTTQNDDRRECQVMNFQHLPGQALRCFTNLITPLILYLAPISVVFNSFAPREQVIEETDHFLFGIYPISYKVNIDRVQMNHCGDMSLSTITLVHDLDHTLSVPYLLKNVQFQARIHLMKARHAPTLEEYKNWPWYRMMAMYGYSFESYANVVVEYESVYDTNVHVLAEDMGLTLHMSLYFRDVKSSVTGALRTIRNGICNFGENTEQTTSSDNESMLQKVVYGNIFDIKVQHSELLLGRGTVLQMGPAGTTNDAQTVMNTIITSIGGMGLDQNSYITGLLTRQLGKIVARIIDSKIDGLRGNFDRTCRLVTDEYGN